MVYGPNRIFSRQRLRRLIGLVLASEVMIRHHLALMTLLLLVCMNWRNIGCGLVPRWFDCSGLLAMANEVLKVLDSAHGSLADVGDAGNADACPERLVGGTTVWNANVR